MNMVLMGTIVFSPFGGNLRNCLIPNKIITFVK